jgi:oligoendopeptidase F
MSKGIRWDLSNFFKEYNSAEMLDFKAKLTNDIAEQQRLCADMKPLDFYNQDQWEEIFLTFEDILKRVTHLNAYVGCLSAADATNEDYAKGNAELGLLLAEAEKLTVYLKIGLAITNDIAFNAFIKKPKLATAAFFISEMREMAQKTMPSELEALAADLSVDGFGSWGRLYDTISGKLEFDMHWPDGRVESISMSQCRSMMQDANREVRKSAFENGNKAWEKVADSCAAALNAISGNRLILNKKRGYKHFLDVALEQARMSQKTLDAMFEAVEESRPFIQEIAQAKAKALGLEKLTWYDCEAPLDIPNMERYSWEECVETLTNAFNRSYPRLGNYFKLAIDNKWIESELRPGKRPGAFCTGSPLLDESRVFMTFAGSHSDVSTLAHEVGHAFHSYQLNGTRPFVQEYPMTLAETASTFAEMILADGILEDPKASDAVKLNVITNTINDVIAFLIDIPIRFAFEKSFHEERMNGEVSVTKLKELMSQAMKNQFGPLLEQGGENPLFWASKLHFYATEVTFYNFPYTFGYLLSRGLFGMFKKEGQSFLPKYEAFLKESGSDMAQNVAKKTLGVDLESKEFWVEAIKSHKEPLEQFNALVTKVIKK